MTPFRLGVYGIDCSAPGSSPIDYSLETLFDPKYTYSFPRYWSTVTGGTRTIEATVHPWINVGTDPKTISELEGDPGIGVERRTIGAGHAIWHINKNLGGSKAHTFDGLAIWVAGRPRAVTVDAGTTGIRQEGHTYGVSYFDLATEHYVIAHELGHLLGYGHSAGPAHSVDQWGTYDDPVDIMSAKRFGRQRPAFSIPAVDRKFLFASPLWGMAGPGVSPATLWRFAESRPMQRFDAKDAEWVLKLPAAAAPTFVKLHAAGPGRGDAPTLVAIPSAGPNPVWTTVEYRPPSGWDRGLANTTLGPGV